MEGHLRFGPRRDMSTSSPTPYYRRYDTDDCAVNVMASIASDVDRDVLHTDDETPPVTATAFFLPIDRTQRRMNARIVGNHDGTRGGQLKESFFNTILDLYAASHILCVHLVTFESLLCVLVSVLATTGYYVFGGARADGASFGANISWMIVSIAVVSPLIMQIKQAYARRELALADIAESRALFTNIFFANAMWNWGDNGRMKLPVDHVAKTKTLLHQLITDTAMVLLLPTMTRGRHRFTSIGRELALSYVARTQELQMRIVSTFQKLHQQVEVMKKAGLPANEASRINQYHWLLQARIEKLQNVKFYRTPQATRSFTRLFILILPIFYGPYYVYLLRSSEYHYTNFGFCLTLSVLTSLTMIGLFNVEIAMEDPFVGGGLDGIRAREMFVHLRAVLDHCDEQIQKDNAIVNGGGDPDVDLKVFG